MDQHNSTAQTLASSESSSSSSSAPLAQFHVVMNKRSDTMQVIMAPQSGSVNMVTTSGMEELQTFLNNFNSELAAERRNDLPESPITWSTAYRQASLVNSVDSRTNVQSSLRIVESANNSVSTDNSISISNSGLIDDSGGILTVDSRQFLIGQQSQAETMQSVTAVVDAASSSSSSNGGEIAPQSQHILIPIASNSLLPSGGQLPAGSTVLLPVVPTLMPNGTVEMRLSASAAGNGSASTTSAASVGNIADQNGLTNNGQSNSQVMSQQQMPIILIVANVQSAKTNSGETIEIGQKVTEPPPLVGRTGPNQTEKNSVIGVVSSAGNSGVFSGGLVGLNQRGAPALIYELNGATGGLSAGYSQHAGIIGDQLTNKSDSSIVGGSPVVVSRTDLDANELPVSKSIVFQCEFCDYTNVKRYLLFRHMKSHSEDRPHMCDVCQRKFKTANSLQNHVNTHTGVRPHQCKVCAATFTTSGEMVRHVRYKHTLEKPHKCPDCDYASVELSKLKRHIRSHTGERPYQCDSCEYASPDMYKLKRHLRVHTGEKPYECNVCSQRFTQSNSLKAHKMIHSGTKPVYQCDYCPSSCGRKTDLKIHVQKQHMSADQPLLCRKCGESFPDRYSLKQHLKEHESPRDSKYLICDDCDFSTTSQRGLETHRLSHDDQKQLETIATIIMSDSTSENDQLQQDDPVKLTGKARVPIKPYGCDLCSKRFLYEAALRKHQETHQLKMSDEITTKKVVIDRDDYCGKLHDDDGATTTGSSSPSYKPNRGKAKRRREKMDLNGPFSTDYARPTKASRLKNNGTTNSEPAPDCIDLEELLAGRAGNDRVSATSV